MIVVLMIVVLLRSILIILFHTVISFVCSLPRSKYSMWIECPLVLWCRLICVIMTIGKVRDIIPWNVISLLLHKLTLSLTHKIVGRYIGALIVTALIIYFFTFVINAILVIALKRGLGVYSDSYERPLFLLFIRHIIGDLRAWWWFSSLMV